MAKRFATSRAVALAGPVGASGPEAEQLAQAVTLAERRSGQHRHHRRSFPAACTLATAAKEDQVSAFLNALTPDDVLIVHKTNPAYTRPGSEELHQKGRAHRLSRHACWTRQRPSRTGSCPCMTTSNRWGEYEPWAGIRSLMQPTMRPLGGVDRRGRCLHPACSRPRKRT